MTRKNLISAVLVLLLGGAALSSAVKGSGHALPLRALTLFSLPGLYSAETDNAPGDIFASGSVVLNELTAGEPEIIDGEDYGEYLLPQITPAVPISPPAGARPLSALTVKGASGQLNSGNLYIKNPTSAKIDAATLLKTPISWKFTKDGPDILIIHTHGSESYNPHGGAYWLADDSSRSLDITQNVVQVGADLARILHEAGYRVLHSTTMYDQPTYSTSYSSALKGVQAYLKKYPSIRMVIDIHRDAMSNENTKYKIVSEINGESCAQLMFVMGTGLSGLSFPNWRKNLTFAAQVQSAVLEKYPTLMRPITITKHRYNEHTTPASCILEVGTDGNTLEEARRAIGYFGDVLAEFLESYR